MKGYDVLVLTNRYPINLKAKEIIHGVTVRRILHSQKEIKGLKGFLNTLLYPIQKRKITKAIRAFSPDVINIHFPDAQLPYIEAAKLALPNLKWVVSLHGHDVLRYLTDGKEYDYTLRNSIACNTSKYKQLEILLKFSTTVTSCSNWLSNKVNVVFPNITKPVIIYNAVDTKSFEATPAHKEETPYLFSFGRLEPCKGFETLIRAYSVLKKQSGTDFPILILAGEGIDQKNLETLIESEQLQRYVFLPGRLNKNEIIAHTKGALINVIPSLREPFGIVLLEALASMKPVLSSKRGGLPEAGGELVTYFEPNVDECAKQLRALLFSKNSHTPEPNQIKEHLNKFTLEEMIGKYETIY